MNAGEISEFCFKAYMLSQKGKKMKAFGEIHELSDDANLADLDWNPSLQKALDDKDWEKLKGLGIGKSKTSSKMDISINSVKYSVKEFNGNDPAIVNHTTRPGYELVCCRLGVSIKKLDTIIDKYWELRDAGKIHEDVKNSNSNCPFLSHKKYMKKIIEYFIFDGTGAGTSSRPADAVLEIDYKGLPSRLRIHDKQNCYDKIWPRLVFSVRSKQMPKNYPDCTNSESIGKWTKERNEKNKGSLHIRYKMEKFEND